MLDNYGSHKHPKVMAWLARHPRWTFHFTPTSASWLNAVEGFFAKLTNRRLRRGVFHSLVDLQAAINRYLAEHNQSPKPFVWTAEPDAIITCRQPRVPSVKFDPLAAIAHYGEYGPLHERWRVLTNVIGTRNVAEEARRSGALAVVQASSDKAVNPTSVIGATKHRREDSAVLHLLHDHQR